MSRQLEDGVQDENRELVSRLLHEHAEFLVAMVDRQVTRFRMQEDIDPNEIILHVVGVTAAHIVLDEVAADGDLRGYFTAVAQRKIRDLRRARSKDRTLMPLPEHLPAPDSPEDLLLTDADYTYLAAVYNGLSPDMRAVVDLMVDENVTLTTAARKVGIDPERAQAERDSLRKQTSVISRGGRLKGKNRVARTVAVRALLALLRRWRGLR